MSLEGYEGQSETSSSGTESAGLSSSESVEAIENALESTLEGDQEKLDKLANIIVKASSQENAEFSNSEKTEFFGALASLAGPLIKTVAPSLIDTGSKVVGSLVSKVTSASKGPTGGPEVGSLVINNQKYRILK